MTGNDICASWTLITPMLADQAHRVTAMRIRPSTDFPATKSGSEVATVAIEE